MSEQPPARVVVTGAAGFIGSHLAEALLARGDTVVGVDAFTDHYARDVKESNLTVLRDTPGFTFHELDLAADDLAPAFDGADVVFHLAALPGLRPWSDFDRYLRANMTATHRVLDAARAGAARHVLHASTSSVYGRLARCAEDGELAPMSAYGVTKVGAETLCRSYERTFGIPLTILRFFSVYGPRQRPDMAYNIFIRALLDGRPIHVHGDGEQSRSNTFVSDVVRLSVAARERPDVAIGETFNVGGGEVVTVNRALELLQEITGRTTEITHTDPRPGDQRHTEADFGKAARLLDYAPEVAFADGLARQVAWQSA